MFRSTTIITELALSLAKVIFMLKRAVKLRCYMLFGDVAACYKWPSRVPDGYLQRVTIPDAVLIRFDLLMMSTTLLETCRGL